METIEIRDEGHLGALVVSENPSTTRAPALEIGLGGWKQGLAPDRWAVRVKGPCATWLLQDYGDGAVLDVEREGAELVVLHIHRQPSMMGPAAS